MDLEKSICLEKSGEFIMKLHLHVSICFHFDNEALEELGEVDKIWGGWGGI